MNEYRLSDIIEGNEPYGNLVRSIRLKRMVPIIGSGFSRGLPTSHGSVPSVAELTRKMIELLYTVGAVQDNDMDELNALGFFDVANLFLSAGNGNSLMSEAAAELRRQFKSYVADNFTNVCPLPPSKQAFLACEWPYLYTLNYDDAIEKTLPTYDVVVPFRPVDEEWLKKERHCIIKLHGDAHEHIKGKDFTWFIMGSRQYLETLDSNQNLHLMNWMKNDFSSKDILFIGCSLEGEHDLLFAETRGAKSLSRESGKTSYYIMYDEHPGTGIPLATRIKLENYGIENVIRVAPDEFDKFYELIAKASSTASRQRKADTLADFTGYSFEQAGCSAADNVGYLFSNTSLFGETDGKTVTFPRFAIERDEEKRVFERVNSGCSICVIMGNRFAGKTYVLLDLLKSFTMLGKNVYYFGGIALSDRALEEAKGKSNSILLIDSSAITGEQIRRVFCNDVESLKRNRTQMVCAVSTEDKGFFYGFRGDVASLDENVYFSCTLEPTLSAKELSQFNRLADELLLSQRQQGETFLDYAIKVDDQRLGSKTRSLPPIDVLDSGRQNLIACMIALAVNSAFDNDLACRLDLQSDLFELCDTTMGAIQRDYLSALEGYGRLHSGAKYVSNSTYWTYRCLSHYANDVSHYKDIAQAFETIAIRTLGHRSPESRPLDFYWEMKPYVFLETLQEMFFSDSPRGGSLALSEMIYERLTYLMRGDYQFLHQHAKCKLRASRRCADGSDRLDALEDAKLLIEKALEIASGSNGKKLQYTLTHMSVTKALILTNYLRYCCEGGYDEGKLLEAVETYHYVYVENSYYMDLRLVKREKNDLQWFFSKLTDSSDSMRALLVSQVAREQAEAVVEAYYKKRVRMQWED